MIWRAMETLNVNLMEGGTMSERERLERVARLKRDREAIEDELSAKLIKRSEGLDPMVDQIFLRRINRLWAELKHVNENIRHVEAGRPEEMWVEVEDFSDLGPDEGAPLSH